MKRPKILVRHEPSEAEYQARFGRTHGDLEIGTEALYAEFHA
jgi:hypothetical protein